MQRSCRVGGAERSARECQGVAAKRPRARSEARCTKRTQRLEHFLILRLVIALGGLLLIQFWRETLPESPSAALSSLVYIVLGAYLLEAVGAFALVRFVKRVTWFVALQIGVDLLTVGIMVASTGGAASLFCPLFLATVFAASTVIDLEGSIVCSSAATVILAAASIVPHMTDPTEGEPDSWRIASCLFTYALALHGVSLLTARLVGGIREAERLTEDIVETMGEGLIAADRGGAILAFNGEARKLLGIGSDERLEGRTIDSVLPGRAFEAVRNSVLTAGERQWQTHLECENGRSYPVEIKSSVLRGRKGNIRGTVLLLRDLTLRLKVDAAARRIGKLEELTEVARGIAHEVRNPLASMCGCAQEIAQEKGISGQTRRLTEILVREAQRVDGIIDDFLSFARIRRVRRTAIDVGELIASTGILLQARESDAPRRVAVEEPVEPIVISGDVDLLTQLLLNVGINALEAVAPDGGTVVLAAERRPSPFCRGGAWKVEEEPGVEITVTDNGRGIPADELGRIFNPFYSQKAQGTGLGLTIAHRIARIHGGTISVSSKLGEGSVFRIWLPEVIVACEVTEGTWA